MRSLYKLSKKKLFGAIYVRDLLARSLQKISMQCLCTRSPKEMSWQDLRTRSLAEVSWKDLCTRSLYELCWQDLCKRPAGKIFVQGVYKSSLYKISARDPTGKICSQALQTIWMPRPRKATPFCASLRSRNAHGHVARAYKSHLMRKFIGKMPNTPDTMSINQRAWTLTIRTHQCGHSVGEKETNNCQVAVNIRSTAGNTTESQYARLAVGSNVPGKPWKSQRYRNAQTHNKNLPNWSLDFETPSWKRRQTSKLMQTSMFWTCSNKCLAIALWCYSGCTTNVGLPELQAHIHFLLRRFVAPLPATGHTHTATRPPTSPQDSNQQKRE